MAEDPNFVPVFGPNGAVMNAPSMTPEMRTKIEQAQALPSGEAAFKSLRPFFLVVFFSALFSAFAEPVRDFLAASQWWAGAVTGALTAIAAMGAASTSGSSASPTDMGARNTGRVRSCDGFWVDPVAGQLSHGL